MDEIYNDFLNIFMGLLRKKMGDPMKKVDIGPMVSIKARDEVHLQVLESVRKEQNYY